MKGRISLYKYHCRFASSPFGLMTCGIASLCGKLCRRRGCSANVLSTNSCTRIVVVPSTKWKRWNRLMVDTLRKLMPRKDVQSNVGTITSPFSVPHSWGMLTVEDSVTTAAMSSKQSTLVFRYRRLTRPKHQSQLNLVWPVSRNDSVIFLCRPVTTR